MEKSHLTKVLKHNKFLWVLIIIRFDDSTPYRIFLAALVLILRILGKSLQGFEINHLILNINFFSHGFLTIFVLLMDFKSRKKIILSVYCPFPDRL